MLKEHCNNPDIDPNIKVMIRRNDVLNFSTSFDDYTPEQVDTHTIREIRQYYTMGKNPIRCEHFTKGFLKWVKTAKIYY